MSEESPWGLEKVATGRSRKLSMPEVVATQRLPSRSWKKPLTASPERPFELSKWSTWLP